MKENAVKDKSFEFSVRIINMCKYLITKKHEYIMSKQVFRSGTSIGANICEALQGSSKADFIAKMTISLKEAAETDYWLRLLHRTGYIDENMANSIINDCQELIKMLTAIIKKSKDEE
ncbi:MAG: four helix bundle protein [Bacteroidaceae bacterium]|nr:four helix bundle protein [Bacteroidaceae bacterium]